MYNRVLLPGDDEDFSTHDPHSAFLRTKLAATPAGAADTHNQHTRIFIPNREGSAMSTHAYVSYASVIVFCQRQIDVAGELPDKTPPGFAELRSEILGLAEEEEIFIHGVQADVIIRPVKRPNRAKIDDSDDAVDSESEQEDEIWISGKTVLHLAACEASSEMVKLLLKKGADQNAQDCKVEPPLLKPRCGSAAERRDSPQLRG
jgi:hypothetical protein